LFGYAVSGHPLELFDDIAWDAYCPVASRAQHVGETVMTCGVVVEQRTHHQITGEPMKFLTLADRTGIVGGSRHARPAQQNDGGSECGLEAGMAAGGFHKFKLDDKFI